MKILVTGSAGFMGSHLVDNLANYGHTVYGIDDLSGGYIENVSTVAKKTFFNINLRNKKKTANFINSVKPKIIYHLAASAREGLSQFSPLEHTENNYNAYLNLLVPAINNKVQRIVLCSSMAVYGDQKPPFDETMPRKPVDIYGVAKSAMEEATEIMADVYNFEYVILRPHNVYGPRQNLADPYRNVVAIFINSLLRNKPFYIYGDGEQKRAFSYIDDITPPLVKAGLTPNVHGEIINIGPEREYSINHLAKLVLKEFNSSLEPIYLADRPREVKEAFCSSKKAEALLGFKAATSFEKGIEVMVSWAQSRGFMKPKYNKTLELKNKNIPKTWSEKLI